MRVHFHSREGREYVYVGEVVERTLERIVLYSSRIPMRIRIELRKEGFRITEDCYVIAVQRGDPVSLCAGAYANVYQDQLGRTFLGRDDGPRGEQFCGTGRFYESGGDIHIEEVREEIENLSEEAE